MKEFLKIIAGTMIGIAIMGLAGIMLITFIMIASISSIESPNAVSSNTVLKLRLQGEIEERSKVNVLAMLDNDYDVTLGLDDILASIRSAATDDNIKGILIESGAFTSGTASLEEIREELERFKEESGKFVYSYSGAYTQSGYYLSSVADSVFLNPEGVIDFRGLAYSAVFYKEALEKIGVDMQIVKVGTFKSFTEQYTNTEMSEASRLQAQQLIDDMWQHMLGQISKSRNVDVNSLQQSAESFMTFRPAEQCVRQGLADMLVYGDELESMIKKRMNLAEKSKLEYTIPQIYAKTIESKTGNEEVAVLYAVGEIDNGTNDGINTTKLCKEIQKLENKPEVKAVVLRVNSPGGSAYGSEQVWHALNKLKQKKPLVVSMGDYAASGGYYISSPAGYIVSNATTMTGSIGIFGVIPNAEELAKKIGVDYDVVTTNTYSDFPSLLRKMDDASKGIMQNYVNRGYEVFVDRCSKGRHLDTASIKRVAEGRVWSGKAALEKHLVDSIGTLNTAIELAAVLADIDNYMVTGYPKKKTAIEEMMETPSLGIKALLPKQLYEAELRLLRQTEQMDMMQAAMPYAIQIK